jgi:hypothetical protein
MKINVMERANRCALVEIEIFDMIKYQVFVVTLIGTIKLEIELSDRVYYINIDAIFGQKEILHYQICDYQS